MGDWVIQRVRDRTESGIDMFGVPFEPYSERYAERKGVEQSNVTLRQTNPALRKNRDSATQMLDAMYVPEADTGIRKFNVGAGRFVGAAGRFVAFAEALDGYTETVEFIQDKAVRGRAAGHQTGANPGVLRPFFGLTDEDQDEYFEEFRQAFNSPSDTKEVLRI